MVIIVANSSGNSCFFLTIAAFEILEIYRQLFPFDWFFSQ